MNECHLCLERLDGDHALAGSHPVCISCKQRFEANPVAPDGRWSPVNMSISFLPKGFYKVQR